MSGVDTEHRGAPAGRPTEPVEPAAGAAPLKYLDPGRVRFFKAGATLRLEIEGECAWLKVAVLRAFPLSCPERYFSVRDGGGQEIGMLVGLDGLGAASRREVETELERRYMVSVIRRILAVKERFGAVDWEADTNRGRRRFTTRDLRENALRSGAGHYLLTDVENNRFEVRDLSALDARSQAWLLRHL